MPARRGSTDVLRSRDPIKLVFNHPKVTPFTVVGYEVLPNTCVVFGGSVTNPAVARKLNPSCHPDPGAVTVKVTVVVGESPPPVAVTVIGYVPVGVFAPTATVIVEVPAPGAAIVLGLNVTVVPLGAPVEVKATELLKAPPIAVVIAEVPCVPCVTLSAGGEDDTVRLFCCDEVTVRLTVAVGANPPPVAVITIG